MQKQSIGPAWKVALAVVAVLATALALYVQLFERRSRQEEDRLLAARMDDALAQSRARLKAEILAQLRAELAKGEPTGPQSDRPLPNTVLRRRESGGGSALQQVGGSQDSPEATLASLQETLDSLARQMEQSDRALRRDLEEIRAGARREQDVSSTVLSLLLVALVPLVIHLLTSLWPPADLRQGADSEGGAG